MAAAISPSGLPSAPARSERSLPYQAGAPAFAKPHSGVMGPGSRPGRRCCKSYLLRRQLPWCGRRVDEIGGELRVARLGVLHRLLLDRAVATDAIRQRQYLD